MTSHVLCPSGRRFWACFVSFLYHFALSVKFAAKRADCNARVLICSVRKILSNFNFIFNQKGFKLGLPFIT